MLKLTGAVLAVLILAQPEARAQGAAPAGLGSEEFGLSPRELVQAIERTEELIARCMRDQGFQYVAADHTTVRAGMTADKKMPGLSEEEFVSRYGFGVSTLYTGLPPQLADGYSPAKVGLGERNVQIFRGLSASDQIAYNRALLGANLNATLAIAMETENLSQTGGCTRRALEQVFKPDQMKASHYNPQDAIINRDPRMRAAVNTWRREMKKAGFEYNHSDEIEPDLRNRLAALTDGGRVLVRLMTPEQRDGLRKLQDFERAVASRSYKLHEEVITPVEERIQQEMFARKPQ